MNVLRWTVATVLLVSAWSGLARAAEPVTVPIAYLGLLPQKVQPSTVLDPVADVAGDSATISRTARVTRGRWPAPRA